MPISSPQRSPTHTVLLHGFTGHSDSWREVEQSVPGAVAITLPGHGSHVTLRSGAVFADGLAFVASKLERLGEPVHLVGYSMGARLALGVCAEYPALVARATLIGGAIGLEDAARPARKKWEASVVAILRDGGLDAFIKYWSGLPLFASQERLSDDQRREQNEIRARHNPDQLALALEAFALSGMPNYWPLLQSMTLPVDVLVGELDTAKRAEATRAVALLAQGHLTVVPNVGHNVLLEDHQAITRSLLSAVSAN